MDLPGLPGWLVQVTGLMTQGRADGKEWVTSYMVSYSLDAYHWIYVNDYYGNRRVRYDSIFNLDFSSKYTYNRWNAKYWQ